MDHGYEAGVCELGGEGCGMNNGVGGRQFLEYFEDVFTITNSDSQIEGVDGFTSFYFQSLY